MRLPSIFVVAMCRFLLSLVFLSWALPLAAQQTAPAPTNPFFEGSLTYDITWKGPGATDFDLLKPARKMDMHIRNGDFIIQMYEAAMPKTLLYLNDSNRVYSIDMANRRIFRRERFRRRIQDAPKAKPTGDSIKIQNLWCQGYRFTTPADPKRNRPETVTTLYVNPKYRVNMAFFPEDKDRSQALFLVEGIQGMIPLRIVVKTPELETVTTAIKVTQRKLEAANFRLPAGFEVAGVDYRR